MKQTSQLIKNMRNILLGFLFATVQLGGRRKQTPNAVFIFVDDMGWETGCYGNDFIDTPNIDQLAKDGMRFTDFMPQEPVCSPTRCAVQSGQNQARIGITAHIPGHWRPFERVINPQTTMALPLDAVTVAESIKKAGYATATPGSGTLGGATSLARQTRV